MMKKLIPCFLIVLLCITSVFAQSRHKKQSAAAKAKTGIRAFDFRNRAPVLRRQSVNPPGISPLVPAYSVAIRHGNMVFISGMTGVRPGTQDIIDGGVAVQTRQTLENIRTSLQAAGANLTDVGECTVFLTDMADYAAMNSAYVEFFRVDPPARATLAVSALPRPAARVEIKCSAVVARR